MPMPMAVAMMKMNTTEEILSVLMEMKRGISDNTKEDHSHDQDKNNIEKLTIYYPEGKYGYVPQQPSKPLPDPEYES